jgi:hypothetical protein
VVQIAFQYSLFTGGLGFHAGADRIGASVIPASSHTNAAEQVMIMPPDNLRFCRIDPTFHEDLSSCNSMPLHVSANLFEVDVMQDPDPLPLCLILVKMTGRMFHDRAGCKAVADEVLIFNMAPDQGDADLPVHG